MPNPRHPSRPMFWRIIRRLLTANRGRLFVILLALGAGAAVIAALLNINIDANRRLTTEFRAFGANVVVAPRSANNTPAAVPVMRDDVLDAIPSTNEGNEVTKIAFLYLTIQAQPRRPSTVSNQSQSVILAGFEGRNIQHVLPSRILQGGGKASDKPNCRVGERAAIALGVQAGELLDLSNVGKRITCFVSTIEEFGGAEDSQVLTDRYTALRLAFPPDGVAFARNVSLIQLNVPGTPRGINQYISDLQKELPEADVHGIRQFTEAEAKIYNRISGLLTATVAVVLILTTLCVMAAMTNVAMERKNDVGLMKAIGGATRRVLRLFLAEAAMLGLLGGALGAAAGLVVSIALGKAVFGVAAQPRLIVYPISVTLTILVAIAGAYPLRRLASIRPASIFRGE